MPLKNSSQVRTRFAPSPTGFLHVGGLRTALYNFLFARQNNGKFLLRIEDTDQKRYVEGALENLISTLKWFGLSYDEGPEIGGSHAPYIQSERLEIYKEYADKLLKTKHIYRCFCSAERLEEMRKKQIEKGHAPMYDRKCLRLSDEEIEKNLKEGKPYVLRLKIPDKKFEFNDLIRGRVIFDGNTIDDAVLLKSDGYPTYHLANVIDDYLMEITHVIRGEEWLPSTPKHIALYEAFGWNPPEFAHLPLLLNKDRSKLSKRQNDVAAEDYIKKGYLKEAILNFIAFLGWNPGGEKEIYSIDEMIAEFSLEKVHKAGAIFDIDKLNWFNWQWKRKIYLDEIMGAAKKIDPKVEIAEEKRGSLNFRFDNENSAKIFEEKRGEKLYSLCEKFIPDKWKIDKDYLFRALLTIEEKILKEPENTEKNIKFYFEKPKIDKKLVLNEKMKVNEDVAKKALEASYKALQKLDNFDKIEEIQNCLIKVIGDLKLKNGQVLWPLRAVLTGEQFSPGVFELIWAFKKEETLNRIEKGALAFS